MFLLLLMVFVSACSTETVNTDTTVISKSGEVLGITQPERTAEVIGIIKSIMGNEAVVAIMDMPGTSTDASEQTDAAAVSLTGTTGTTGTGGGGAGGGIGDKEAMIAEKLKNSKENMVVSIPVGILMTKKVAGEVEGEGGTTVEANLSDVVSGKMVSIWLHQEIADKNIAEFVSIR